jgi:quercetin dioxygenase-like cupin family protein
MPGTVRSHQAIASALGLRLPQLYGKLEIEANTVEYQPITERTERFTHNDKASYNLLTSKVLAKKMMPVMIKIQPGGSTTPERFSKDTERFIYILKGECKVYIEKKPYLLKRFETLYFDASFEHYFKNSSSEELKAICITSPPML